jgi:hypothetical protein
MADIKIQGWMKPPSVEESRNLVGQIVHVAVGGEITSNGIGWFDLFRFARVLSVRQRMPSNSVCPHCNEDASVAFDVIWESDFKEARAKEICEHCIDGCVTAGGDSLTFAT